MAATTQTVKPAPAELRLVQDFVNTLDIETGLDEIDSPIGLLAWLAERRLAPADAPVAPADVGTARELREGLRRLLEGHTGAAVASAEIAPLNRIAARTRLTVAFAPDGTAALEPTPSTAVEQALGGIVAAVFVAALDGSWERLKACRADDCRWAFYDRSRNRSGQWCDMEACGSRAKVRAFRARRR